MSESQRDSDQEYFCSDAVRGKTFVITNGPDADVLCKALGEAVDARHPDWPLGYRTVYFNVFNPEKGRFVHLTVAVTGLVWEGSGLGYKGGCTIYGFVGSLDNKFSIEYVLREADCDRPVRTGRITFCAA